MYGYRLSYRKSIPSQYNNNNHIQNQAQNMPISIIHHSYNFQYQYHKHDDDDRWSDNSQHQQQNQHEKHEVRQLHGLLMTIAWVGLLQLGIWSHYFRSYRYAILVHVGCMLLLTVLSVISLVLIITSEGKNVIWQHLYHQTIGFLLIACILPITVLKGAAARLLMSYRGVEAPWVITIKQGHRLFGWILVGVVHVPVVSGWGMDGTGMGILAAVIGVVSYGLFWYLKLSKMRLEETLISTENKPQPPPPQKIFSLSQYTAQHSHKTFMFGNKIYTMEPVLVSHPGGQTIIEQIRGREVDRYLYGMEMIDRYASRSGSVERHAHGWDCLRLAERPVSGIGIGEVYGGLGEVEECGVQMYQNQAQNMYLLYLSSKCQIRYEGYKDMNQLGRFRAISINGIARLYSNVEFLRSANVKWMNEIMGDRHYQQVWLKCHGNGQGTKDKGMEMGMEMEVKDGGRKGMMSLEEGLLPQSQSRDGRKESIPLFVKKYNDGIFTSDLDQRIANPATKIIFSESRGFGLGLPPSSKPQNNIKKRIVMIAGGTGLHPFCDLIDLLYKNLLITQNHPDTQKIFHSNPILSLQYPPFEPYTFILYLAIDYFSLVHPITLFQCEQLAKNHMLECYFKVKMHEPRMERFQGIQMLGLNYRFQLIVEKELAVQKQCKFLVCGSVAMGAALRDRFRALRVSDDHYRIL